MNSLVVPGVAMLVAMAVLCWPASAERSRFVAHGARERIRSRGARRAAARDLPELPLPDVLDLIALALDSGASTVVAVRAAGERLHGGVGTELRSVAAALEWGLPESTAWASAPARWAPAARALSLADRAGVPPAALLRSAAEDLRRQGLQRVEAATARLGVRLVLPLGLAFLPAFVLTTIVPVVLALAGELLSGGGSRPLVP